MARKRHAKNLSITDGTTVPPSFRKDGARRRFSPSRSVPPPTGLRVTPVILMRVPRRYRRGR
jgi:hypothetical protein